MTLEIRRLHLAALRGPGGGEWPVHGFGLVINTHLHFDHCGQNAVFAHAPVYVQRAELARAQREAPELRVGWAS